MQAGFYLHRPGYKDTMKKFRPNFGDWMDSERFRNGCPMDVKIFKKMNVEDR